MQATRFQAAAHGDPPPVTWEQVAAFRMDRHHLADRAPVRSLVHVVGAMGGAQAQALSAAQMSLWARVDHLRVERVASAVRERALVRAWRMRRTLHLLPAEDLAVFVRGTARRAERAVHWVRRRGVSDRALERLIAAALAALDRPLGGRELVERVSRALGVRSRTIRADGWGSGAMVPGVPLGALTISVRWLLLLAAARGVVCSGPSRGNEPTFVRADAWVPRWHDIPKEQAEGELLRRYLRAFGPATPADFALWTGMPVSGAREIWARERSGILPVDVEGWTAAILRDDLRRLARTAADALPARLLPYFDAYLLGHRVRRHLVAPQHHGAVYRPQGWIAPVVLVDGRVAGVWSYAREREGLRIDVTPFAPLSRPHHDRDSGRGRAPGRFSRRAERVCETVTGLLQASSA